MTEQKHNDARGASRSDAELGDTAYELGAAAYKNDLPLAENPFRHCDMRFDEWEDGWCEALDADAPNA